MDQRPKVMVCQHGARHRYSIPRMLEEAGMLASICTDSSSHSILGKIAKSLINKGGSNQLKRLAQRKIEGIPEKKIFSTDVLLYRNLLRKATFQNYSEYLQWCTYLSNYLIRNEDQFPHYDIYYGMFCENLDYVRHIKNKADKKIVSDIYIHPNTKKIIQDEATALGEKVSFQRGIQNINVNTIVELFELSDVLLCPSKFVADGVVSFGEKYAEKIAICPYGSSINFVDNSVGAKAGKIFWAGGDWLRKGLHKFAAAADQLICQYPELEFRVAGITNEYVTKMPRFKNLQFLGKLNYEEMQTEFLEATCFVIPSLSEGMAGVAIEALASGCPVIMSSAVGIDGLDDGVQGFIVDCGESVDLLCSRIEAIFLDDRLRTEMSVNAKALADTYSLESWKKRLVKTLCDI